MNVLSAEQRAQVVTLLTEGNSLRATCRMTGFARNTVSKLLLDLGDACAAYSDEVLRDLPCERIECDEMWAFIGGRKQNLPEHKKDRPDLGDSWLWVAIDVNSKLVPTWRVGSRDYMDALLFMQDLRSRLANRVQLTTDRWGAYPGAVEDEFGADVDYAMRGKPWQDVQELVLQGRPRTDLISTSIVERSNLTTRQSCRRYARLTNAHSKALRYHVAATALHWFWYNFGRPHSSLGKHTTPAMAVGKADHVWRAVEVARLLDSK